MKATSRRAQREREVVIIDSGLRNLNALIIDARNKASALDFKGADSTLYSVLDSQVDIAMRIAYFARKDVLTVGDVDAMASCYHGIMKKYHKTRQAIDIFRLNGVKVLFGGND